MQAYVQWINPGINSTVQEFYQNPTIQVSTASILRQCLPKPLQCSPFYQNSTILVSCLHVQAGPCITAVPVRKPLSLRQATAASCILGPWATCMHESCIDSD